jgi:hypothetical protein
LRLFDGTSYPSARCSRSRSENAGGATHANCLRFRSFRERTLGHIRHLSSDSSPSKGNVIRRVSTLVGHSGVDGDPGSLVRSDTCFQQCGHTVELGSVQACEQLSACMAAGVVVHTQRLAPQRHHNPATVHGTCRQSKEGLKPREPRIYGLRRLTAVRCRRRDGLENHGVSGSNPGPAT